MARLKKDEAYCICCGWVTDEYDSICLLCKLENRYPKNIYGV